MCRRPFGTVTIVGSRKCRCLQAEDTLRWGKRICRNFDSCCIHRTEQSLSGTDCTADNLREENLVWVCVTSPMGRNLKSSAPVHSCCIRSLRPNTPGATDGLPHNSVCGVLHSRHNKGIAPAGVNSDGMHRASALGYTPDSTRLCEYTNPHTPFLPARCTMARLGLSLCRQK